MNIKTITKTLAALVAVVLMGALLTQLAPHKADAQPAPGNSLLLPYRAIAAGGVWTNKIAGSTSVTNATKIALYGYKECALQWTFTMAAGGTTNQTLYLYYSLDGTNKVAAHPCASLVVAANGTGWATVTTNISTGGYPYLFADTITNAFATGTHYMTGYSLIYNLK